MAVLDDISRFEFEDLMKDVFRNLGHENVRQAGRTADEGRDVLMEERVWSMSESRIAVTVGELSQLTYIEELLAPSSYIVIVEQTHYPSYISVSSASSPTLPALLLSTGSSSPKSVKRKLDHPSCGTNFRKSKVTSAP